MYKLITLLVLFFIPVTFQVELLEVLKLKTFDSLVTKQEPSGNFTILNIINYFNFKGNIFMSKGFIPF